MPPRSLILMRHAQQSGHAPTDHERPLTKEGRRDAKQVGRRLAGETPLPAYVLSSTAIRCRETWRGVAAGMGCDVEPDFDANLYNASSSELLSAIAGVDERVESLMVLAHNPGISMLALQLAGSDRDSVDRLQHGFTPATTARFEIDGPWSTLSPRTARLSHFDRV